MPKLFQFAKERPTDEQLRAVKKGIEASRPIDVDEVDPKGHSFIAAAERYSVKMYSACQGDSKPILPERFFKDGPEFTGMLLIADVSHGLMWLRVSSRLGEYDIQQRVQAPFGRAIRFPHGSIG